MLEIAAWRPMQSVASLLPSQEPRRDTPRAVVQCVRWPFKQYLTTGTAPFRTKVDDPVSLPDDVQMVLDQDNRVLPVHEPRNDAHQQANIRKVQPSSRFVHHVDAALFVKFGGELCRETK